MQPVNNDIDNLYRKAAEDYPLSTNNADWNKLLEKMEAETGVQPIEKKEKKTKFLWLLLLLPMFFICNHYANNGSKSLNRQKTNERIFTGEQSTITKEDQSVTSKKRAGSPQENSLNSNDQSIVEKENLIKDEPGGATVKASNIEVLDKQKKVSVFSAENKRQGAEISQKKISRKSTRIDGIVKKKSYPPTGNDRKDELAAGETGKIYSDQNPVEKNTNSTDTTSQISKATATQKTADISKDSVSSAAVTKKAKTNVQQKKLYWGVFAGPDLSMVKSTKMPGVGFGFGILGGYRFSKKWAVETGVLWDKKEYESEGQYFKTEKAGWPRHTRVIDIAGYCKMFEVPIAFRFDFSSNKKQAWFATAGVSSYFMKNEDYDYTVERYGVRYKGQREYKNSSTNWLSMLHLSVGYQKTIGGIGSLRVEPYVKLPLKGVGIGSLPLRSTGLYMGITRPVR